MENSVQKVGDESALKTVGYKKLFLLGAARWPNGWGRRPMELEVPGSSLGCVRLATYHDIAVCPVSRCVDNRNFIEDCMFV